MIEYATGNFGLKMKYGNALDGDGGEDNRDIYTLLFEYLPNNIIQKCVSTTSEK